MVELQSFCSQIDLSLLAILAKSRHAIATPIITLLPFQQLDHHDLLQKSTFYIGFAPQPTSSRTNFGNLEVKDRCCLSEETDGIHEIDQINK